jgi:hypothetical protein
MGNTRKMNGNKRAIGAGGKPFKNGDDPRRGKNGRVCAERASWAVKFNNAMAQKITPDDVAEILIKEVRRGRPWAIELYLDRVIGKASQPIEHTGEIAHKLKFDFGENGENGI